MAIDIHAAIDQAISEAVADALASDQVLDDARFNAIRVEAALQIQATLNADDAGDAAAFAAKDAQIAALQAIIESLAPIATPDAFAFAPVLGAQLSQQVISNEITVAGIKQPVIVTSTIPRSKNGGPYTMADGVAVAGDRFTVQLASSDLANAPITGTLTIGAATTEFSTTTGDFLTPMSMFPQQIHRAWFQEDVSDGAVASWHSRGRQPVNATQGNAANRPTKLPNNGGVAFAKNAVQWLQWSVDTEAPYSHRWWIVIAKADLTVGANPTVLSINGTNSAQTCRQPLIDFDVANDAMRSIVFDTAFKTQAGAAVSIEWNILLGYRRGWKHHAVVNGVKNAGVDFAGFRVNNVSAISQMGHSTTAASPSDTAIDLVMFGDGELTDKQVDVLVGWAHWRVSRQSALPVDHPYRNAPPANSDVSATDFHTVEEFDAAEWAAWDAAVDVVRYTHRGEQTYNETGYKRVFITDFDLADQAPAQALTGAQGRPWYAPGHLTTLSGQASSHQSNGQFWPNVYVQDTGADAGGPGRPGTLNIRMHNDGAWKSGAIYSVNDNGLGRTWGKGIFKVRMKFSHLTPPLPGLFPGPQWFYGAEHIFQRTRNRVEQDTIELTGKGAAWNEGSVHVHKGRFPYPADPTTIPADIQNKVYGYEANAATGFPETFNAFDGEWHDWVCKIDDDLTYYYLSIDGVLYETCRVPTTNELRMQKYWITNHALDAGHGDRTPAANEVFDMTIDYIEVMQKETDLAVVPAGFSDLPAFAGSAVVGQTLTVTPNTAASQVEYLWYRDGVPITTAITNSYSLTSADVGHKIRVHVKARSLVNQPEAWTDESAVVS